MQAYIQKWGNSLGLRIPLQLAKHLNLHQGSPVNLEIDNDCLVIQSPKYNLDTMLNGITSKNQHHLNFDHDQKSHEAW